MRGRPGIRSYVLLTHRPEPTLDTFGSSEFSVAAATPAAVPDLHVLAIEVGPEPLERLGAGRIGRDSASFTMAVGAIWEDRTEERKVAGIFWSSQHSDKKQNSPLRVVLVGRFDLFRPDAVGVPASCLGGYHRDLGFSAQDVGFAE